MRLPQSGLVDNNVNLVNLLNTGNEVTERQPSGGEAVRYTRKHRHPSKTRFSVKDMAQIGHTLANSKVIRAVELATSRSE